MPNKKSNSSPAEKDPYEALMRNVFPEKFGEEKITGSAAPKPDRDSSGQPAGVNLDTYWDKPSSLSP